MKPLRLAVIGAGHLGRFHALQAAQVDEIDLIAVVDPNDEARNRVAHESKTLPLADYRTLVGDIDAAVVATPTYTHHAIAGDLLDRGTPVLVEKPLASTAWEAADLCRRARQRSVVLQVGHVERFNPAFACVESEFSNPKFIEATRLSGYSFRSTDIGVVLDVMIHDLDIVLALTKSPISSIEALGISVLGGHEDMASARIMFADGCVAQLTASRVSYQMQRTMQVATTRSFTSIDFAKGTADVVQPGEQILRRSVQHNDLADEGVEYWKQHLFEEMLKRTTHAPEPVNAIQLELREFAASVREGAPVRVDGQAGSDAVAVAEQIVQRIEEHQWDGHPAGRCGPFAMPALPILRHAAPATDLEREYRRAG